MKKMVGILTCPSKIDLDLVLVFMGKENNFLFNLYFKKTFAYNVWKFSFLCTE